MSAAGDATEPARPTPLPSNAAPENPQGAPSPSARPGLTRARLAVAWLLAVAPLAAGWFTSAGVDRFSGVSSVALCGVGWLFVVSMPRAIGSTGTRSHELAGVALVLAPLAAAAGLDVAQGVGATRAFALAGGTAIAGLVLGDAARRAARTPRAALVHALAWFALVAAPPLAEYALYQGGAPFLAAPPSFVFHLARWSPLGTLADHVRYVNAPVHVPIGVALVVALVASAAAWRPRGEELA